MGVPHHYPHVKNQLMLPTRGAGGAGEASGLWLEENKVGFTHPQKPDSSQPTGGQGSDPPQGLLSLQQQQTWLFLSQAPKGRRLTAHVANTLTVTSVPLFPRCMSTDKDSSIL